jgi:hypothetical protein
VSSFAPGDVGSFDLSLDCQGTNGPDLVSNIPVDSALYVLPAESISLQAEITNAGDEVSSTSKLRWLLSSDANISLADTQVDSHAVLNLNVGESQLQTAKLSAPTTPGPYWIGACVDPVYGESATTNNCSNATPLTVDEPPDCFSSNLSCGGARSGSLNSSDCTSGPRGAGYYAKEYAISLTAGEPVTIRSNWSNVDGYLYLLDSSGRVVAQNDDNLDTYDPQSLLEFIPTNGGTYHIWSTTFAHNQSGGFSISADCGSASSPDLVTTASLLSDSSVSVGDTVLISYTISNEGNGRADATEVLMCLSKDPVISLRDSLLASGDIGSLAAGESVTLEMEVTVPEEPGDYWVGPCAKAVSGEAVTSNNCTLPSSEVQFTTESFGNRSKTQESNEGGLLLNVSSGSACNSQVLACGQSMSDTLVPSDCDRGPRGTGFVSDAYTISGASGDTLTLSTQWDGIDGYLYLEGPSGVIIDENDDFQGKGASRIEVVLPQSGNYTVWPTAFGQGDGGSYQLSVECNNPQSPDLEVDRPTLSTSTIRVGQSLGIKTRVSNLLGYISGSTAVDFILAANPELAAGDRILTSSDVPPLQAGQSTEEEALVELNVVPGTYYIGSCVDVDASELDTENNCQVSGPITVEQTDDPIAINTGLNDAWYDPGTNGQGFFINVFPDTNVMFLSWFTFDTERPPDTVPFELGDPGHRWLTAQGVYDRGVAELQVSVTEGGVFDAAQPAASPPAPYGSMTVRFSDCNNGTIDYDLTSVGETGTIPITRVADENVAVCEEMLGGPVDVPDSEPDEADSVFTYNASLNDAWYDPGTNGQGFFFNVYPGREVVFMSWFTYDVQRPPQDTPYNLGEPGHRWQTAQGKFSGDTANLTVNNTSGGVFNAGDLPPGSTVNVGTITATFDDCNAGVVAYNIDSINRQDEVSIERLARDTIPACEKKSKGSGDPAVDGVTPADKQTVENLCNGSVDWHFDWPDVEGAGHYLFQLYRNDSLELSPRLFSATIESEFDYSGKEPVISQQYLDNWKWRYQPILSFGTKRWGRWSDFYEFNVRPPESPCEQ